MKKALEPAARIRGLGSNGTENPIKCCANPLPMMFVLQYVFCNSESLADTLRKPSFTQQWTYHVEG